MNIILKVQLKEEKRRNTLVNAKHPLGTPEGHFVLYGVYAGGLSSNSGVLGNGSPIHCILRFSMIAQCSKGAHYYHRVVGLLVCITL